MIAQSSQDRIALYRGRAEATRHKADKAIDRQTKAVLRDVAETWDRLADLETRHPQPPSSSVAP